MATLILGGPPKFYAETYVGCFKVSQHLLENLGRRFGLGFRVPEGLLGGFQN